MSDSHLLTWEEAKTRSQQISQVTYDLRLGLSPNSLFVGTCTIRFHSTAAKPTWVDFKGDKVASVTVNGQSQPFSVNNWKISVEGVVEGPNEVIIPYEVRYSNDGFGLHKYQDPEDQSIYLYSMFAPFSANRMLPCFDQPDLKASLTLTVSAPSDWRVISNEPVRERIDGPGEVPPESEGVTWTTHVFEPTARISTYLYALCCGHYEEYRCDDNDLGIPIGLFCRRTLAKHIKPDWYFKWTVAGHKFYRDFFGCAYPFRKYDQVFVPEFNMGAMENVGCVTFRDQYVFKDTPSQIQLARVCDTFLHELAHMWFGNLVTMKWWDDLWLNESFATFMSHLCTSFQFPEEYPNVWIEFLGLKGWGYSTDQLPTTHPISTPVRDTNEAESNLDGISYAKGSAVLKQLYFLVGHEPFKLALQKYMRDFAFLNVEFSDLVRYLAAEAVAAGNSLQIEAWAQEWVKTSGLNELEPVPEFNDQGVLVSLKIKQTAASPAHPTLRNHALRLRSFGADGAILQTADIRVAAQEFTEITELNGSSPACLLLNVEDWGYCKVRVDERSVQFTQNHLNLINDPLSRQLVWRALYDMVLDLRMPAAKFVEFAVQQIPSESDPTIANYALGITAPALYNYTPAGAEKDQLAHSLFEVIFARIQNAQSQDESVIFQKTLLGYCYTLQDINTAVGWVQANSTGIEGFPLSQLNRWTILKKFAEHSLDARALVEEELKRDSSDTACLSKLYCEAAYPTPESKAAAWEKYMTSLDSMSRYERENSMAGFNRPRQRELLGEYTELSVQKCIEFLLTKDKEIAKDFCENMIPNYVEDEEAIRLTNQVLDGTPEDKFDVIRMLKEAIDQLAKHAKGKALSREYLANRQ